MANLHECEDYDFPVKQAKFTYTYPITIVAGPAGGTYAAAVQDAINKARDEATQDGEAAMRNETCKEPCKRIVFVDVTIEKVSPAPKNVKIPAAKPFLKVRIQVSGIWKAGILCYKAEG